MAGTGQSEGDEVRDVARSQFSPGPAHDGFISCSEKLLGDFFFFGRGVQHVGS